VKKREKGGDNQSLGEDNCKIGVGNGVPEKKKGTALKLGGEHTRELETFNP